MYLSFISYAVPLTLIIGDHTGLKGRIVRSAMKSYKLSELTHTEVDSLKARPRIDFSSIFSVVSLIMKLLDL